MLKHKIALTLLLLIAIQVTLNLVAIGDMSNTFRGALLFFSGWAACYLFNVLTSTKQKA